MAIVYTETFTNSGADAPLQTFDSRWAQVSGGGTNPVTVPAANDRGQTTSTAGLFVYRMSDAAIPTTDLEIACDVNVPDDFGNAGPIGRMQAGADTGYYLRNMPINELECLRRVAGVNTFLSDAGVSLTAGVTYAIKLKITGTNPVVLAVTFNGSPATGYSDSSASRIQTGGACIGCAWQSDFGATWIDNLTVDDLASGAETKSGTTQLLVATRGTPPATKATVGTAQAPGWVPAAPVANRSASGTSEVLSASRGIATGSAEEIRSGSSSSVTGTSSAPTGAKTAGGTSAEPSASSGFPGGAKAASGIAAASLPSQGIATGSTTDTRSGASQSVLGPSAAAVGAKTSGGATEGPVRTSMVIGGARIGAGTSVVLVGVDIRTDGRKVAGGSAIAILPVSTQNASTAGEILPLDIIELEVNLVRRVELEVQLVRELELSGEL